MYSNNIVNFQESTTILNVCAKKVWKLIEGTTYVQLLLKILSASLGIIILFLLKKYLFLAIYKINVDSKLDKIKNLMIYQWVKKCIFKLRGKRFKLFGVLMLNIFRSK